MFSIFTDCKKFCKYFYLQILVLKLKILWKCIQRLFNSFTLFEYDEYKIIRTNIKCALTQK